MEKPSNYSCWKSWYQVHSVFWDWNGRRLKIVFCSEEGCIVNCSDHTTRNSKSYSIFSLASFVSSSSICNAADAEVTKEARAYGSDLTSSISTSGLDFWQSPFQELNLSSVTDISKSVLTCWKGQGMVGWNKNKHTKIVSNFGPKELALKNREVDEKFLWDLAKCQDVGIKS